MEKKKGRKEIIKDGRNLGKDGRGLKEGREEGVK